MDTAREVRSLRRSLRGSRKGEERESLCGARSCFFSDGDYEARSKSHYVGRDLAFLVTAANPAGWKSHYAGRDLAFLVTTANPAGRKSHYVERDQAFPVTGIMKQDRRVTMRGGILLF